MWVGKVLSEGKTAVYVDVVTLTLCDTKSRFAKRYREPVDPKYTKEFNYPFVQGYNKRLRFHCEKQGITFRFVVIAEYGEKKGRVHYHMIRFFYGGKPTLPETDKDGLCKNDPYWPHGNVHYEKFDLRKARYVCYYVTKTWNESEMGIKSLFRFSTRPAIGYLYLQNVVLKTYLANQVPPISPYYTLPEYPGMRWKMSPHTQVRFCRDFDKAWYEKIGDHYSSTWVNKVLDNYARSQANEDLSDWTDERWVAHLSSRGKHHRRAPTERLDGQMVKSKIGTEYEDCPPVFFDEIRNAYYSYLGYRQGNGEWKLYPELGQFWWSFDERGERVWSKDFVTEYQARRSKASYALMEVAGRLTAKSTMPPRMRGLPSPLNSGELSRLVQGPHSANLGQTPNKRSAMF